MHPLSPIRAALLGLLVVMVALGAIAGWWMMTRPKTTEHGNSLFGDWRATSGEDTIDFQEDGKVAFRSLTRTMRGKYVWKPDGELTIDTLSAGTASVRKYIASLSGRDLVLTTEDGKSFTYRRILSEAEQDTGLYPYLQGERERNAERFDKAFDSYVLAIDADPNFAPAYLARGKAWLYQKQYDEAAKDFDRVLELMPNLAEGYYNRGLARVNQELYEKAIADYDEALRLAPQYAEAILARGAAWQFAGNLDRALADMNLAIKTDPDNPAAHLARGALYVLRGETDKAIEDFSKTIKLEDKNISVYLLRAHILSKTKQYAKAFADYQRILELDSKNAEALSGQAWLWATCPVDSIRDGKRAVEAATKACDLTKHLEPRHLSALAAAYAETGDYASAAVFQAQALKLRTDDAAFQRRGRERLDQYRQQKPWRDESAEP